MRAISRTLGLLALAITAVPSSASAAISAPAEQFVLTGPAYALRRCDLAIGSCGKDAFAVQLLDDGEADDEGRVHKRLSLPGMELQVVAPGNRPSAYFIQTLTISAPAWPLPYKLKIGSTRKLVEGKLGRPSSSTGRCSTYASGSRAARAEFCYASDKLSRLTWNRTPE
ncbi:hypothetical protein ABWL39_03360 [Chitinivorax sp. PXF-14]|uniref:hypothetical protein n=1 Tax=Chitinivorax sp. PXF-14 TaxID=3230488 RepID=UPI0034650D50